LLQTNTRQPHNSSSVFYGAMASVLCLRYGHGEKLNYFEKKVA